MRMSVKFFISILFILTLPAAFAGKVVVMSSLEISSSMKASIEKKFRQGLRKSERELTFIHEADPTLLFQVLRDENTEALIWISHSAKAQVPSAGTIYSAAIMDVFGNDVKRFFSTVTSRLRFLAVIGCESQGIMDDYIQKGYYRNAPDLEVMSFDKKILIGSGVKRTLVRLKRKLSTPAVEVSIPNERNIEIRAVKNSLETTPSWIEMGDRVLSVLGAQDTYPKEIEVATSLIDSNLNRNIKLRKILRPEYARSQLPAFEFSAQKLNLQWHVFSYAGTVIGGKEQHLYRPVTQN